MKFPYIIKKDSPYFFHEGVKFYNHAIPSEEKFAEYPWPKSLCDHAPDCPISDSYSDKEEISSCPFAAKNGCPINLLEFDEFAELETIHDVEIFEVGKEATKDWTTKDLDRIVKNFGVARVEPPMVVLGHNEKQVILSEAGLPAAGWVSALRRIGNKLICDFKEMPRLVADALRKKAYKFVSAEIYPAFLHKGKDIGKVLRRVALLGADIPKIKGLNEVMARYSEDDTANQETIWIGASEMKDDKSKTQTKTPGHSDDPHQAAKTTDQPGAVTVEPLDAVAFAEKLKQKEDEIESLKKLTQKIEDERAAEKHTAHMLEIDRFCEDLKASTGLSAAIVDEGGLKSFLSALDHNSTLKFSETEEKTAYDKAVEVFSLIAEKAQKNILTVPLSNLKEPTGSADVPKGVDEDGFQKDQEIRAYSEKNNVSYEEAYQALYMGGM